MPRRFHFWHRAVSAMLGLFLSISAVGQQLPCVHATVEPIADSSAAAPVPASEHAAMRSDQHAHDALAPTAPAPQHSTAPQPAPHHDPAAPGCAQLMACGLAVQGAASSAVTTTDFVGTTVAPIGQHLQYSTADLEVESPPPRA